MPDTAERDAVLASRISLVWGFTGASAVDENLNPIQPPGTPIDPEAAAQTFIEDLYKKLKSYGIYDSDNDIIEPLKKEFGFLFDENGEFRDFAEISAELRNQAYATILNEHYEGYDPELAEKLSLEILAIECALRGINIFAPGAMDDPETRALVEEISKEIDQELSVYEQGAQLYADFPKLLTAIGERSQIRIVKNDDGSVSMKLDLKQFTSEQLQTVKEILDASGMTADNGYFTINDDLTLMINVDQAPHELLDILDQWGILPDDLKDNIQAQLNDYIQDHGIFASEQIPASQISPENIRAVEEKAAVIQQSFSPIS
jgi:hypothetical protein